MVTFSGPLSDISEYISVGLTILDDSFTIKYNMSRYYPSLRIMVLSFGLNSGNISSKRKQPVRIQLPSGVSSFSNQHLSCVANEAVDSYYNTPLGCFLGSTGIVTIDKADVYSIYAQPWFWGVFPV